MKHIKLVKSLLILVALFTGLLISPINWSIHASRIPITHEWVEKNKNYNHYLINYYDFSNHHNWLDGIKTELTNKEYQNLYPRANKSITKTQSMKLYQNDERGKHHIINHVNIHLYNISSTPRVFRHKRFTIQKLSHHQMRIIDNETGAKYSSKKRAIKELKQQSFEITSRTIEYQQYVDARNDSSKIKHFRWHNRLYHLYYQIPFKIAKEASTSNGLRYYYIVSKTTPHIKGWVPFYNLSGNYGWFINEYINFAIKNSYNCANLVKYRNKFVKDYRQEDINDDATEEYNENDGDAPEPFNPIYYIVAPTNSFHNKALKSHIERKLLKGLQKVYLKTPKRNRKYLPCNRYPTNWKMLSKSVYKFQRNISQENDYYFEHLYN